MKYIITIITALALTTMANAQLDYTTGLYQDGFILDMSKVDMVSELISEPVFIQSSSGSFNYYKYIESINYHTNKCTITISGQDKVIELRNEDSYYRLIKAWERWKKHVYLTMYKRN